MPVSMAVTLHSALKAAFLRLVLHPGLTFHYSINDIFLSCTCLVPRCAIARFGDSGNATSKIDSVTKEEQE